jgi:hypothetical protein
MGKKKWDNKIKLSHPGNLSAGICDNCIQPEMINTGGDGRNEPVYMELYCKKKQIFIEPFLPEEQIKECDFFYKEGLICK